MRSRPHSHRADTRANIGLIFGSIASIVVLLALFAAILGHFPLLGWLGFGIASVIANCLEPGEILTLPLPADRPIDVYVGGLRKMTGRLAAERGRLMVMVEDRVGRALPALMEKI